ncbi:TIGR02444 family protein [Aliiglaciecola sp. CAU 1673]|uniref:TIGR02444 family protein n=1 Tax=Aliiglaciecola sp. CAU 1673 TaxID=3032595 RepID=UPI0023DB8AD9|nr:TIGR02444 family protein [Aliiglaciecola sp. CAU 1673]MDF2179233.1 TIGR02444 family protein [Aliiglaciecola sp. CAU 1673]
MPKPSAEALWAYSLECYSQHRDNFLHLQDRYGLNVNLLLLCLYLQEQGYYLDKIMLASLCQALVPTESVLTSLRQVRKHTKALDAQAYASLKQAELALEARQQCDLLDALQSLPLQASGKGNLLSYCKTIGVEVDNALLHQLNTIHSKIDPGQ